MSELSKRKFGYRNRDQVEQSYFHKEIVDKIITINHRIDQKIKCYCDLCQKQYTNKLKRVSTYQRLKQSKSTMLHKKSNTKILLTFLLPKLKKTGFKILIPEICFYENGEPQSIFMCSKQEIRQIKSEKLSQIQVLNIFLQQNKIYKQTLIDIFQKEIMKYVDLTKQIHEKYLQTILPSWKPGGSEFQNTMHSVKFHKDDRLLMDNIEEHKDKQSDQICLVRYLDGNFILLNETQFKNLMKPNKKKYIAKIEMIQSFIKPKRQSDSLLVSMYDMNKPLENQELFNRALLEIEILLQIIPEISPLYITNESLDQFNNSLKESSSKYVLYQTYKIVHYLERSADIRTQFLKLNWLINDINLFYMTSVIEFEYQNLDFEELRKLTKAQFSKKKAYLKQYNELQKILFKKWQQKKVQKKLLDMFPKKKTIDRSNQIFQRLHPNTDFQSLMNKQSYPFKRFVQNMTLTTRSSLSNSKRLKKRTKYWCNNVD